MTVRHLERFFRPRSLALFGASPEPDSVGHTVIANLCAGGFSGPIWPVNPNHAEVAGLPCFADAATLPEAPDLAVIATPAATIPAIAESLAARGNRAMLILSAGLGSGKGSVLDRVVATAKHNNMRILGPNGLGVLVPEAGLNASFAQRAPLAGKIAFISQSGAVLTSVLDWASSRGIGFSHMVSLGNMADVDIGDMLDYLAGDTRSRAILMYLEGIKDARGFMSAARRAARAKPVIAIKAGRHATSARAAASHTGALAGSDAVFDAAFERAGILRAHDLQHLFDAAETLSHVRPFRGERLAIITNGGGAGILAVDALADRGGVLADLAPETLGQLNEALPAGWSGGNPVDIIGDAGAERYRAAMQAVMGDPNTDAILVMRCPTAIGSGEAAARAVLDVVVTERSRHTHPRPVLTCWLGAASASKSRSLFHDADIASFELPLDAVDGFTHLVRYSRAIEALMRTPPLPPENGIPDRKTVQAVIEAALAAGRPLLDGVDSKRILTAYGIPAVEPKIAATPDEVEQIAAALLVARPGTGCVVKIASPDISHKSDAGGVRLNISSAAEAAAVAASMQARIMAERPEARLTGFAVEPMIATRHGHELIAGLADDASFGRVVLFGAGGTGVEVVDDKALGLPPLDPLLARRMIERTRVFKLLSGYRDRPAADIDAIVTALVALAQLAADFPQIRELDINPLIADETGIMALDARCRVAPLAADEARRPHPHFAIRPYPREWEADAEIVDFGPIRVRPVRPEDEHLMQDFFDKLTPHDIRMRLFAPMKSLSHAFAARLTQIDYAREMALVAFSPDEREMLGVSRLSGDPDHERAEFAVIVRSDLKGHGLGWELMQRLIAFARQEGFAELFGYVLCENTTMLKMCRDLGFKTAMDIDDAATYRVTLALIEKTKPEPA
jgi:acetyltransferase